MNLVDISIKRPTFITCIVLIMLAVGTFFATRLGVDLFPNVTFPIVVVSTPYPGASPSEIETLISKPLEDEVSTISGVKRISSVNQEGLSQVITEFTLETDVKYAEQQIRDRLAAAKRKFPTDAKESTIKRIDPSEQPILALSVEGDLPEAKLFDVADEVIRPKLEQISQVGLVEVIGGRKREIHVALDRNKLKSREISATQVAGRLTAAGENIPVGKITEGTKDVVFRALGQFGNLEDISETIVNFFGSEVPVTVKDIAEVQDTLADESTRTYVNGKKSLFLYVFKQSGSNTIAVVDGLLKRVKEINVAMESQPGKPKVTVIRDASIWIRANVLDVQESIFLGVLLAVIVVYFFLANGRSTIITGLALPNSLIGAFILMAMAGFTINIMTLLALSLSVGLLVDDAIVVRENIFRYIEKGMSPEQAARQGTKEVQLAVIATTLTVLAVFGPVGFLKGVTGQFFQQFGLTICFAMMISLFDALTVAPMLSAYFAGKKTEATSRWGLIWESTVGKAVGKFSRFQDWLEIKYENLLRYTLAHPFKILAASFVVFLTSCVSVAYVPKTFLPQQDAGEFAVTIDLPPGTSLEEMSRVTLGVDKVIRQNAEVEVSAATVGGRDGQSNVAEFYIHLVKAKQRKLNTGAVKEKLREQLKSMAFANPVVKDYDAVGGGMRPFTLNIIGDDQKELEEYTAKAFAALKNHKGLKDVDTNYRPGKPELQIAIDSRRADKLGVSNSQAGMELRAQIEGVTTSTYRENDREYDIRVRLKEDQRNLREGFNSTFVPNINHNLVRLRDVANGVEALGPSKINRQDRSRYLQIAADIAPGAGLGDVMTEVTRILKEDVKLPSHMRFAFIGQAENFKELSESMAIAMGFGVLFIFLVLASLYESFVTPLTIMLALPLALCGAYLALFVTGESLNIFSMIGSIMLLGVATKNSILLVDYATQKTQEGVDRATAIIEAGKTRLRPILMTTMALIAGTIPIALGLNEASRQRTSMGVTIIGGLISSTLLTLVVIPAAYTFVDRFRIWSKEKLLKLVQAE